MWGPPPPPPPGKRGSRRSCGPGHLRRLCEGIDPSAVKEKEHSERKRIFMFGQSCKKMYVSMNNERSEHTNTQVREHAPPCPAPRCPTLPHRRHAPAHASTPAHMQVHWRTASLAHIRVCSQACRPARLRARRHTRMRICPPAMHTCMLVQTHTRLHTRLPACTHACMHACTHGFGRLADDDDGLTIGARL